MYEDCALNCQKIYIADIGVAGVNNLSCANCENVVNFVYLNGEGMPPKNRRI